MNIFKKSNNKEDITVSKVQSSVCLQTPRDSKYWGPSDLHLASDSLHKPYNYMMHTT